MQTKALNLAVKRNAKRLFQIETSNERKPARGGRRYLFTEHGVATLSSVLKSERAVQMNIATIGRSSNSRKFWRLTKNWPKDWRVYSENISNTITS